MNPKPITKQQLQPQTERSALPAAEIEKRERRDLDEGRRIIRHLTALLGKPVVLIPIYPRSKRPRFKRFQTFTLDLMEEEAYIACIGRRGCNVAVLLGEPSGGLCTLDFDDDEHAKQFLACNPHFCETLATTARRGRNLWFWVSGKYPASFDLPSKTEPTRGPDGEPQRTANVFEFRATGRITIIHGTHPCGFSYRLLHNAKAITVRWQDIVWPPAWRQRVRAILAPAVARRSPPPPLSSNPSPSSGRSLDIAKLKNVVVQRGGEFQNARCPACAAAGGDQKGNHLIVYPSGAFGCVLHQGQSAEARSHRALILQIAGL